MTTTVNKKEVTTKATITIALESEAEVQAFKNILTCAGYELRRRTESVRLDLEEKLINELQNAIEK